MSRTSIGSTTLIQYPIDGADFAVTTPVLANQLQFAFTAQERFGLKVTDAPVTGTYITYVATGPGKLTGFHASIYTPGSAASVTVDLYKNGASILASVITLTNATAARTNINATINTVDFVAGDEFTIPVVMTTNTGMAGIHAVLNGVEYTQPL